MLDILEQDVENHPEASYSQIDPTSQDQKSGRHDTGSGDRTNHCTVSSLVAFAPVKNHLEAINGPVKEATPWKA